jgi:hypothetical protein
MGEILDTTIVFFQQDAWSFTQLEDQPILRLGFQGESGQWTCYAQAREEQAQFLFYSLCPVKAPEDKRMAVAEFLTRANYGMFIGNFELDYSDGEIRYRTSIDVEGSQLTPALVRPLVYANVLMMDRYLPGIMSVIYGNVSPAEAVAKAEGTAGQTVG